MFYACLSNRHDVQDFLFHSEREIWSHDYCYIQPKKSLASSQMINSSVSEKYSTNSNWYFDGLKFGLGINHLTNIPGWQD